jgi:hypothetical protein
VRNLLNRLPERFRTKLLFHAGLIRIPMMRYIRPKLIESSDANVVVRVNLSRRTKNMYNSLYLGALAVGADCVTGFFPAKFMLETGHRVPPIIKTSSAEYYKRVNTYAHFTCTQGTELWELCNRAVSSGERLEATVIVLATAPKEFGDEPVAKFTQVISLKKLK